MCFNGSMHHRNLPYISGPVDEGKCPTAGAAGNIFSFCEAALKISGPVPIRQQLGRELGPGTLATAVTATSVGDNTVAIVGTQASTVIKVLLADGEATVVDSFVAAEGEPVLAGTRMHPNNVELLVLTPTRLRRLKIADCGQLGFCGECLSKRDPFCGWCSLQNECTLQDDCSDLTSSRRSSAAASKWLSLGAKHQCIHLENIAPSSLAVAELSNISLQIFALPELPPTDQYQCVYDGHLSLRQDAGRPRVPEPAAGQPPRHPPGQRSRDHEPGRDLAPGSAGVRQHQHHALQLRHALHLLGLRVLALALLLVHLLQQVLPHVLGLGVQLPRGDRVGGHERVPAAAGQPLAADLVRGAVLPAGAARRAAVRAEQRAAGAEPRRDQPAGPGTAPRRH